MLRKPSCPQKEAPHRTFSHQQAAGTRSNGHSSPSANSKKREPVNRRHNRLYTKLTWLVTSLKSTKAQATCYVYLLPPNRRIIRDSRLPAHRQQLTVHEKMFRDVMGVLWGEALRSHCITPEKKTGSSGAITKPSLHVCIIM